MQVDELHALAQTFMKGLGDYFESNGDSYADDVDNTYLDLLGIFERGNQTINVKRIRHWLTDNEMAVLELLTSGSRETCLALLLVRRQPHNAFMEQETDHARGRSTCWHTLRRRVHRRHPHNSNSSNNSRPRRLLLLLPPRPHSPSQQHRPS